MTTPAQAARRAAFYADLRSGNFTQIRGEMRFVHRDGTRSHCCLGVAQERYQGDNTIVPDTHQGEHGTFMYNDVGTQDSGRTLVIMSFGAADYYGFGDVNPYIMNQHSEGETAASWNDDKGKTFTEIADMFEQTFPAVADEL